MSDNTTVPWRCGSRYSIHVYADDVPVAMFLTSMDAHAAVRDHNAALNTVRDDGQPASYTCPFCGAVSHHPHDVAEEYCGRCHSFANGASPTPTFPQ